MKILKIKIPNGYKLLEKGFEISFLSKTRVDKNASNDDLIELENDFYYPIETAFVGKNSSGKTTTLELIAYIFSYLREGRLSIEEIKDQKLFDFEILFYEEGIIYKYYARLINDEEVGKKYLRIEDEYLEKTTLKERYKKDLSNASFFKENSFIPNINGDTSILPKYIKLMGFNFFINSFENTIELFETFYRLLGRKAFLALLHLFDDSVEYIEPHYDFGGKTIGFNFKRIGEKELLVDSGYLVNTLSKGTIRGINLYGLSFLAFLKGGHIIVDEIEKSFNRNLVENLFVMFNDKSLNKCGASIIYSTHYAELLDWNSRCDNINVLHRNENVITMKNMYLDYKVRTEMLKSNQFSENAFDTNINYNRLMELKDTLRN